jgi:hypothetical protein
VWVDLSEGVGFMGSGWSDLWGRGIEVVGGCLATMQSNT